MKTEEKNWTEEQGHRKQGEIEAEEKLRRLTFVDNYPRVNNVDVCVCAWALVIPVPLCMRF